MKKLFIFILISFFVLWFSDIYSQRMVKFSMQGTLLAPDSVDAGGTNKLDIDTLRINLANQSFTGVVEVKFKYDTSGNAYTEGKLPRINLQWGYAFWDTLLVPHPDSSGAVAINLEDSVKHYNLYNHFKINPEAAEHMLFLVRNTDSLNVNKGRTIPYTLEVNVR